MRGLKHLMISPFYLDIPDAEISELERSLGNILRSGTLILGPHTKKFEAEFASYIGTDHAVSLNTGTSALEVLMSAYGARGKRVAVQSNTNFASVAAIIRAGGKPIYMDMTKEAFAPNLEILKYTHEKYQVAGVMWVHIGGVIAKDFCEVVNYCNKHVIFLVEDAAHAHGSAMNGIKAGAFANAGAFSFFPTKVMTTIEGGMITTNDPEVASFARSMRNQGKRIGDYGGLHHDLGNSWRMPEISAHIGLIQLAKLDKMVSHRMAAASKVARHLDGLGYRYCRTDHMDKASTYKFIVHLKKGQRYDVIKNKMSELGVGCGGGVYELPCHLQPVFKDVPHNVQELSVTETYCPLHICPPITSGTSQIDIETINNALTKVLG
jgi:perosamine synthetase